MKAIRQWTHSIIFILLALPVLVLLMAIDLYGFIPYYWQTIQNGKSVTKNSLFLDAMRSLFNK